MSENEESQTSDLENDFDDDEALSDEDLENVAGGWGGSDGSGG